MIFNDGLFHCSWLNKTTSMRTKQSENKVEEGGKQLPVKDRAGKKRRKRRGVHYSVYLYHLIKLIHPDLRISSKAMSVMNTFVNDMFDRIATEAGHLARHCNRSVLLARDIQAAVRLLLPGQLGRYAEMEASKAVNKYASSWQKS